MSTRCQIGFYEGDGQGLEKWESLIYRHCDGYPEGVLPDLEKFLTKFIPVRGNDCEYCAANFLAEQIVEKNEQLKEWKGKNGESIGTILDFCGFGVCRAFHSNIEYFYAVYPSTLKVYDCGFNEPSTKWKEIKSIDLKQYQKK